MQRQLLCHNAGYVPHYAILQIELRISLECANLLAHSREEISDENKERRVFRTRAGFV
jgi:hypothetical protein